MKRFVIKKGKRFSWRWIPRLKLLFNAKKRYWHVKFTEQSKYTLKEGDKIDEDQKDWNKLLGISYNFTDTRTNTSMVGWRYNIEKDVIDCILYTSDAADD